jgi:hypothetical protein
MSKKNKKIKVEVTITKRMELSEEDFQFLMSAMSEQHMGSFLIIKKIEWEDSPIISAGWNIKYE